MSNSLQSGLSNQNCICVIDTYNPSHYSAACYATQNLLNKFKQTTNTNHTLHISFYYHHSSHLMSRQEYSCKQNSTMKIKDTIPYCIPAGYQGTCGTFTALPHRIFTLKYFMHASRTTTHCHASEPIRLYRCENAILHRTKTNITTHQITGEEYLTNSNGNFINS